MRIQDTPPLTDIAHPYSSRTRWSHNDRHHRRIVVPVVTVAAFLVQLGGLSLQAAATPAFVQSAVAARTSSGGALSTPARTTTTGNLFVVAVSWDDGTGTTVTVTDNKGNAYASATSKQLDTRHNQALQVFYATNGLGGANHTFTATPSRTATSMRLVVHEVSGVSGSNALDGAAVVNDAAGAQVSVGPVTTTTNGDYIFAVAMNDSGNSSFAPTSGNGFTERATAAPAKSEMQTQDTIKATAGSIAATWTMSRTNDAMAQQVAFKPGLTLPSDTTPPTPPANLVVGTVTQTQVNLSWTASTDNVGVTGYRVYRNTAQSGTTTALSYQDTGLTSATSYTYEVAAVDAAGNVSARSAAVVATTQSPAPDTQAPTAPANLQVGNATSSSVALSWTASTDDVAVSGYRLERCQGSGCVSFVQIAAPTTNSASDTGLTAATTYRYRARAADAAGNLSGYSNIATVTTAQASLGVHWPLRLNTAGKYLEDQSGTPYLLVADAGWEMVTQLRQQDAIAYLDDRLAKGFNAVEIRVIGRLFQSNAPNNYYNEPPFVNGPSDWSIRNEAYWSHVDYVLNAMRSRGMVVLMFPAYLGYGCGGEGWCPEMLAQTNAAMTNYGQWIGNRYKDYGNVIWMTGGDVHATGTALDRNNSVRDGIRSVDADAMFSVEPVRGEIGGIDSYVGLVDINAVYAGDPSALVRAAYLNGKPFMYQEGHYENEHGTTAVDLESQALITYLGGGLVGHTYGSCPLWFFSNATTWCNTQSAPFNTWQNNLNSPGSIGVGNVGKLMRSRSWRSMVPDYSNSTVLSAKNSDIFYRAAAREANGETVMAWARDTTPVTVDLRRVHGPLAHAWWYSPANGTSTDLGNFSTTGTLSFIPPASRLVLVLDDASLGLAAPGTTTYSFAPDTTAPTTPTGLLATAVSASSVHLSWTASTDDRGVAGYRIVRQGQQIATVSSTSYDDQGLQQQTRYTYTVSAFDWAQNVSGSSASATATTLTRDTTPPSVPTNLAASTSVPGQISLTWNAATDDTGSVAGYVIRRNGVQLGTSSGTLYVDTGLAPSTTYAYSVAAFDATGNTSAYSSDVVATTPALPSGLVAAYSMNQSSGSTLPDVSGRGNTGHLVNGPSWVAGKYGNALSFNGSNQRVDVGDAASLDLTTGMTLAAWVRPATVSSFWRDVIMKGADEYYLAGSSPSGGAPAAGGTFTSPLHGPALVANTWSHLAATYDGATFRLFINGVQVASRSQSGAIRSASGVLGIGGDPFWGQYFSGAIDEVRIYNRALSPAEVQSDMNTAL